MVSRTRAGRTICRLTDGEYVDKEVARRREDGEVLHHLLDHEQEFIVVRLRAISICDREDRVRHHTAKDQYTTETNARVRARTFAHGLGNFPGYRVAFRA